METENRVKVEVVVNELNDLLKQIKSVSNVLNLLYSFLSGEHKEISEPSGAMLVCIAQLEHVYKRSDELLDNILKYCDVD